VRVRRRAVVLFDNANSLFEEVAKDSDAVFFGNKHGWD
jgi:hypothetical protein